MRKKVSQKNTDVDKVWGTEERRENLKQRAVGAGEGPATHTNENPGSNPR